MCVCVCVCVCACVCVHKYIYCAQWDCRFLFFFFRNVRARGPVEQWLGTVEAGMFETVKK